MANTLELIAIHHIQSQYPNCKIERLGFPVTAFKAVWDGRANDDWEVNYEDEAAAKSDLRKSLFNLHPDAYTVLAEKKVVVCIEIEDSHKLTVEKLQRYISAFWTVDMHGWQLGLVVSDRYGANLTELYPPSFSERHIDHNNRVSRPSPIENGDRTPETSGRS